MKKEGRALYDVNTECTWTLQDVIHSETI